jgi:hypothetical protein
MPVDHHAILRDMHRVAGEYHRHFSIARTTASSLFVPIGILTSISMLTTCKDQHSIPTWAAFAVILFIVFATLALNIVFSSWSDICRRLEKYYESIEGGRREGDGEITFDAGTHGFRHLFNQLAKGGSVAEVGDYKRRYVDVFVNLILVFGLVYLIGYTYVFDTVCRGGQLHKFLELVWREFVGG